MGIPSVCFDCGRYSVVGGGIDRLAFSLIMTRFSIASALRAAVLSKQAYSDTPPPDSTLIDLRPDVDVQALVVQSGGRLDIAFRGTFDMGGWITDASIRFHDISGGVKAHSGFYHTMGAIWPRLMPYVSLGLPIYTTGHSKGAAEARQFTYRLAVERGIKVVESYTFGEPRSLNWVGARAYDALGIPTFRVMDELDIVCRVPWRMGLYRHVQSSAFFDVWGNVAFNEPWYAHLPSDICEICKEAVRFDDAPVKDHGIDLYIQRLTNYQRI